ncbi:MAG: substrate-binding domain-containing protein [Sulfolobales archaeon]
MNRLKLYLAIAVLLVAIAATVAYVYYPILYQKSPLSTPLTSRTLATSYTTQTTTSLTSPSSIRVVISTTTSLYATGLLDYLAQEFNRVYPNINIMFVAVGTGAALKIAEKGDSCAVMVHAPSLEKQYIDKGVIEYGRIFAYNFFVVVGPSTDPAQIRNASSVVEAFKRIYLAGERGEAIFVSRGDNSGTHVKELSIWNKTGLDPHGKSWYKEAGAGMDQVLIMSNELKAYTLSDIGTYLQFKKENRIPNLELLYYNDSDLINIYSMYLVKKCPEDIKQYAKLFLDFVYENQDLIGRYGVDRYGAPLFYPARGVENELKSTWDKLSREG